MSHITSDSVLLEYFMALVGSFGPYLRTFCPEPKEQFKLARVKVGQHKTARSS